MPGLPPRDILERYQNSFRHELSPICGCYYFYQAYFAAPLGEALSLRAVVVIGLCGLILIPFIVSQGSLKAGKRAFFLDLLFVPPFLQSYFIILLVYHTLSQS